jgi:3-oxocholest-4-en-26-oyl-CoA dehydrogenase beta subunit
MYMDLSASRVLTQKAIWEISQGMPARRTTAMAKARTGETFRRVTTKCHQIFGAIGFTMEHDLHYYYRQALACDQDLGNYEFQRENVARELGL